MAEKTQMLEQAQAHPKRRNERFGRLTSKIIFWSFLPTVLILIAVALVHFQAYQQATEDLVVQRNRELARRLAERVSSELNDISWRLKNLADRAEVESSTPEQLRRDLSGSLSAFPMFDGGVLIYDIEAREVAEIYSNSPEVAQSFLGSPLYQHIELRRRGWDGPLITDIAPILPEGPEYLAVAVPTGAGRHLLIGLMTFTSENRGKLAQYLDNLRLSERGQVYLVEGNGRVLYHSNPEMIGMDFSPQETVRQVLASKIGSLHTRSTNGQDRVVSYAPVLGTRWGLVVEENWAVVTEANLTYTWFLLGLLALGVAIPATVVIASVRRITRPLADLTRAAEEVAAGKLGQQIEVHTDDEVEDLAHAFNRMSRQLQESYATLEQRVERRTHELATLNALASVVNQTLDLEETLKSALVMSIQALDMEFGAVFLTSEEGDKLELVAQQGLSPSLIEKVARLASGQGAAGQAVATGQPQIRWAADYEPDLRSVVEAEGMQLVIGIPLLSHGRVLGALIVSTKQDRDLRPEELELLSSIGKQVGVAVENARLYEQAERNAVQAERNRLARDLHDAVTQTLFSVSVIADVLPRLWERNPDEALRRLEELGQLTRGALAEMRTLLMELRPAALMDAETSELFRHLTDAFVGRARIPIERDIEVGCQPPAEVKVALYRMAQEMLNNVAKHSNATQVRLSLRCLTDRIELSVEDDGSGFDPTDIPPDHMGVRIMRERAAAIDARFELDTRRGRGTRVQVVWTP